MNEDEAKRIREAILYAVREGCYSVSEHAEGRMDERRVLWQDVEHVLEHGTIVGSQPGAHANSTKYVVRHIDLDGVELTVIIARTPDPLHVRLVTVY